MPRLDFEKQFAGQLKERELQPSGDSWKKLQEKLDLEEKKSSPMYLWAGIAASVAGAILVLNFVFNDPIVQDPNGIVDTELEKEEDPAQENGKTVPQIVIADTQGPSESEERVEVEAKSYAERFTEITDKSADLAENKATSEPKSSDKQVQIVTPGMEGSVSTSPALASEEDTATYEITDAEIEKLLAQAIAEVSKEMPAAGEITDTQIDALLAEAIAEVKNERTLYQTATFDAENLLLEVETELEHSFREQVFEIIRDGLKKTRNAVVNINE